MFCNDLLTQTFEECETKLSIAYYTNKCEIDNSYTPSSNFDRICDVVKMLAFRCANLGVDVSEKWQTAYPDCKGMYPNQALYKVNMFEKFLGF